MQLVERQVERHSKDCKRQVEEDCKRQVEEELDMGISPKNNSKKDVLRQYFIECLKPIINATMICLKPIICVGKLLELLMIGGLKPINGIWLSCGKAIGIAVSIS